MKILICEDEPLLQKLFRLFVRPLGHTVLIASDGREGLALAEQERPDVILTDISMPYLDGFQLAEALRAQPDLASIPLIFITGFAQTQDRNEAKKYHAFEYLTKPVEAEEMRAVITRALQKGGKDAQIIDTQAPS